MTHLNTEWLGRCIRHAANCFLFFMLNNSVLFKITPCPYDFPSQTSNKSKPYRCKLESPRWWKPPQQHQNYSMLLLLQHLFATPNPEVWKFISWCPHRVKYSKALFNLLKFTLAVPTLCIDIPSVRLHRLSHLPSYSQVPAPLPARAAPFAHHLCLLSSAILHQQQREEDACSAGSLPFCNTSSLSLSNRPFHSTRFLALPKVIQTLFVL